MLIIVKNKEAGPEYEYEVADIDGLSPDAVVSRGADAVYVIERENHNEALSILIPPSTEENPFPSGGRIDVIESGDSFLARGYSAGNDLIATWPCHKAFPR